jgi:hypothetical protein
MRNQKIRTININTLTLLRKSFMGIRVSGMNPAKKIMGTVEDSPDTIYDLPLY